ncbi:uncharacterized protein LOC133348237 [Lethenteron reissneri]|uniref:uncharacterized protein LOC133348237 n=1 Tax=Lethenteron reissneri TaxID=7753 RepID=UPI002AB6CA7D|nr:uncharacterized protein LOC133348237 [Lethenteron reissneri]
MRTAMVILGMVMVVMVVMVISSERTDACRDGQQVRVNEKRTILNCSLSLSSGDHLVKIEWRRDNVVIFYYSNTINHQLEASEGYTFFGNIQSGDASLAIEYVYAVKFRSFSCKLITWRELRIDNAFCLISGSGGTRHPTTALTANPSKQNDVGGTSSPRVSIGGGKVYMEDWVWMVIAAVGFVVLVIIIALLAVWTYRRNQQRIIERYNNRRTSELQESMSYINIKDVPEEFLYEN